MRASILDQPSITVTGGHEEEVDRDHRDDRPIRTADIVQSEDRVDDRDIGLDEADAIIGERRLRGAVDGLRLGTEVLHHGDSPLQKVAHGRHEGSIFGKQRCADFGILLNEGFSKGISELTNGCLVSRLAGTRRAGRTDDERTCEKRQPEALHRASER